MLIRGARLPDGRRRDVLVEGERISAVGVDLEGKPVIEADGWRLMPGGVDVHVHLREPGDPHKETWPSGTRAAAAGGVTTVVDQPNTDPPTVDRRGVRRKLALARGRAIVDYAINGGVTAEWRPEEVFDAPIAALGEIFMADSTGEMGVGSDLFEEALARAADRDLLVTVHAEDDREFDPTARDRSDPAAWSAYRPADAEIAATDAARRVAEAADARWHLAHASTPEAVDLVTGTAATCEVTPHHLFLSTDDLEGLGPLGRMNPPLRSEARRAGVLDRLRDGTIDVVATDHAPHTREEKRTDVWTAPSGVPGVETMLPLLLAAVNRSELDLDRVAEVTARAPADRFGFDRKGRIEPGFDADLALFDLDAESNIAGSDLVTACGWTPFEGHSGVFPALTLLRGRIAHRHPDSGITLPSELRGPRYGPARGRNLIGHSSP